VKLRRFRSHEIYTHSLLPPTALPATTLSCLCTFRHDYIFFAPCIIWPSKECINLYTMKNEVPINLFI